jgi:hypothetical protein
VAKAAANLSIALHGLIQTNAVENVDVSINEAEKLARKALGIFLFNLIAGKTYK